MASTGLNLKLTNPTTYTVPANKKFMGQIRNEQNGNGVFVLNGVNLFNLGIGETIKAVVFNAGDVLGPSATNTLTIWGQLYDV